MSSIIGSDVIDLRDVVDAAADPDHDGYDDAIRVRDAFIADGLAADADDFERYADDEPVAIHARWWVDYVAELAEDIAAIPRGGPTEWPVRHIDWQAAADELAYDYSQFDVGEHTYYVRSV